MTGRLWLSSAALDTPRKPTLCRLMMAAALLASLAAGACVPAWSQASTSVRGTVTDPGGSAIVAASVVLANSESKTERSATTGDQGEYQFLFVPPGTYTLTVRATGFRSYEQKGLALLVNTPATAN